MRLNYYIHLLLYQAYQQNKAFLRKLKYIDSKKIQRDIRYGDRDEKALLIPTGRWDMLDNHRNTTPCRISCLFRVSKTNFINFTLLLEYRTNWTLKSVRGSEIDGRMEMWGMGVGGRVGYRPDQRHTKTALFCIKSSRLIPNMLPSHTVHSPLSNINNNNNINKKDETINVQQNKKKH